MNASGSSGFYLEILAWGRSVDACMHIARFQVTFHSKNHTLKYETINYCKRVFGGKLNILGEKLPPRPHWIEPCSCSLALYEFSMCGQEREPLFVYESKIPRLAMGIL